MKSLTHRLLAVTLCAGLVFVPTGCSSADVQKSVTLVEQYLPTAIALAGDIAQIVAVFAVSDQGKIQSVTQVVQSDLSQLNSLCQQYTANPSATTYQSILAVVDNLVANGDAALLNAAKITNATSKQQATVALASLDAVLHIIDGYVQQTQSTKQVKATAAKRSAKLATLTAYYSDADKKGVENAFHAPFPVVLHQATAAGL